MDKQLKNNEITLSILWKVVRERWLILLLALILGVSLGFSYSRFIATPIYSSSAEFLVENTAGNANASGTSSSYQQGAVLYAASYAKVVEGNVFNEKVASEYSASKEIELKTPALQKMIEVAYEEDTPSFRVTVTSTDPEQALELLRIYEQFVPMDLATRNEYINVSLVSSGLLATTPDSPNVSLNVILGGVLFLLITYVIFFLISFLDKTVYEEETLKDHFDLPVIGSIPEWVRPGDDAKALSRDKRELKRELRHGRPAERDVSGRLLGSATPFSITEAFKTLRTNLVYVDNKGEKCPVFGVVSDFSGAGKSLVASNVAIGFAQLGKKVLLIDGDMRCPTQHRIFEISRHKMGLSEALAGISDSPLTECAKPTQYEGLDLMTCGRIPPNPNELLSSKQMEELLELAKQQYDYILIDLPPICATSDAGVLAPLLTGYVFVVRTAYSNLTALHDSFDILKAVNANVVGFVMNDINMRQNSRYYGTKGRYSHYYGLSDSAPEMLAEAAAESASESQE